MWICLGATKLFGCFFFFNPAHDCIFFLFAEDISVYHVNYCLFRKLLLRELMQHSDRTDCLTDILRMLSQSAGRGLFLDSMWFFFFFPPGAASTIRPENWRTVARCWNGSEWRACHRVPATSAVSIIKKPMHISVNWVFSLLDYLRFKNTYLLLVTGLCRYSVGCLRVWVFTWLSYDPSSSPALFHHHWLQSVVKK